MLELQSGGASMKGKNEGRKKRKGGKREGKKEKERGKKFHSRARTCNFPLYSQLTTAAATACGRIARTNVLNRHISRISIVMN